MDFRSTLPETNGQSCIDASVGSNPGQIAPLRPAREPKRQTQAELSAQRLVLLALYLDAEINGEVYGEMNGESNGETAAAASYPQPSSYP